MNEDLMPDYRGQQVDMGDGFIIVETFEPLPVR